MSPANKPAKGEVQLTTRVAASRQALFLACSTTEGLEGWYADVVRGRVEAGETLRLEWPEVGAGMDVRVSEVVRGQRVVFEGQGTQVTLQTDDQVLHLCHRGVPESTVAGLRSSWTIATALLSHGLEWHPGGRRKAVWGLRQVDVTPELAHLCLTDRDALRSWLGDSSGVGGTGDPFTLTWCDGTKLSGHVLAQSPGGDVAVSLRELDRSVLTLRTLPAPRGCHVALCWSTWGTTEDRDMRGDLGRALDRLRGLLSRSGAT